MGLGKAALIIAQNELGNGEGGRNNHGFHINRYRRGFKPLASGSWCATFICYCLEEGWTGLGKKMKHFPIQRTNSANKLAVRLQQYGARIEFNRMRPGDILLWERRGGKHINICYETSHDTEGNLQHFRTIDGNKGPFPALVDIFDHHIYPKPLKVIRLP